MSVPSSRCSPPSASRSSSSTSRPATRGYVITRDPAFLDPWRSARRALPAQSRELLEAAPGERTRRIDAAWRAYLRDWSIPLVSQPVDQARAKILTGEGKRRVDRIRALVDPFIASQRRVSEAESARVAKAEHRGEQVSVAGIAITVVLFALMVAYVLRRAVLPLRRVVAGHARIAAGEQNVEVPEGGAGEVGTLATAFNEMSRSLSTTQSSLAAQNDDLERLANVLRAVLDSTVDGILLSDAHGEVQLANRPVIVLTRDLGMSYEGPVVDRLLSVADRMADPDAYRAAMERLRANPDEPTFDEFEDASSGRVFQGFTAPVLDDRGGFLGRIWTLREVTEQRELDRLKDDFVATVSHELRTPLTSMMGFLEMVREGEAGELNDEQQRFLAIVYRSSERLQRLVGDLLFVARLDANGLQLQFADVDVTEVVRDAVESTAALARSRSIDLRSRARRRPVRRRRQGAALATRRQPDLERAQVHARGGNGDGAHVRRRRLRGDRGHGHRHRHPGGRAVAALPALLPFVDRDRAGDSRHGARPRHLARDRRGARRHDLGAFGARRGDVVSRRAPVRRGGGRGLTRIVALDVGSSSVRAVAYDAEGTAEPGAAHLTYDDLDVDRLVDACRAVLAQVGEGDALALSCFWHSLVAVDERDRPLTPVLTWRDLASGEPPALDAKAYHRRTGCFLHPAYWPAKIRRLEAEGLRPARYLSFGDLLLGRLTGEVRTSISIASGTGLFDPSRCDWDGETLDSARADAGPARAALGRAGCRCLACARRRRVLERRRRLHDARPRGGDGRHLGCGARDLRRDRRVAAARASSSTGSTGAASARGARSRTAATCTPGCSRRCRRRHPAIAERPPAAHGLVFLPFLGGERSLGWDASRRGLDHGAVVRDDTARHRPGRARRRLLPLGGGARRDRRRRVRRRHGRARCSPTPPGCRCWPTCSAGRSRSRRSQRRRRAAPRSSRSSGSVLPLRRRRSTTSSSRGPTGTRSICSPRQNNR